MNPVIDHIQLDRKKTIGKMRIMDTFTQLFLQRAHRLSVAFFWLVLVALATGVLLSVLSALNICTQACSAGHKYRLYGWSFETMGLFFFFSVAMVHFFSIRYAICKVLVACMLAGAIGAEVMFIYAQKFIIGKWCPLCLGIAASIAVAFAASIGHIVYNNTISLAKGQKGVFMKRSFYGSSLGVFVAFGFFFAQEGFSKFSQLQAAENSIKQEIAFGNAQGPIEVYVFTDWQCPACRKIEPTLSRISPEIMNKAKLIFADLVVHTASLNFVPYNVSFMIHNKPQYFKLRDGLTAISEEAEAPTEKQIQDLASKVGTKYIPVKYSDVTLATNFFNHVSQQFKVDATPTVVIVNSTNKKGKKLSGSAEITRQNILNAIEALK